MKNKNILLSIIVPVYNVEKYIEECLQSILVNNNPFYELIIINDGTQDNSMKIVHKYKNIFGDKLYVIEQNNKGLSVARNNGINHAQGKYVWCVDSDDFINENAIDYILTLINNCNTEIIAMPLKHCYVNGNTTVDFSINNNITITGSNYLKKGLPLGASQRYIIKKSFLCDNNLHFIPNKLHEDGDFGLRLLYYAQNICVINKPLYNYRIRENGSIMSSWKIKNSLDLISIYDDLLSLYKQNPLQLNVKPYYDAAFRLLIASILFAQKHWNDEDFINFYKNNKNKIRNRALNVRPLCSHTLKKYIMMNLFIISPITFCKFISYTRKI